MLEKATVTMPYTELKELLDENREYKEKLEKLKNIEDFTLEEFEANPFKKGLDTIFDLLEKASKFKKANEKQHFIYASMKVYCETFEIPTNELLEDTPKGIEPE